MNSRVFSALVLGVVSFSLADTQARAESMRSDLGTLCFGSAVVGTNGEHNACVDAANRVNALGSSGIRVRAFCRDVRNDLEARLESGCWTAAFVVTVSADADTDALRAEQRRVTKSCERSRSSNFFEEAACTNGTDPVAIDAKRCATELAIDACRAKGLQKCTEADARLRMRYYYYSYPRCVATATIQN